MNTCFSINDPLYGRNIGIESVWYYFCTKLNINKGYSVISQFSEEDYDAFCLAYMFTYRDFEGGTLGLAWTGDLKNAGGVCEKNGVRNFIFLM